METGNVHGMHGGTSLYLRRVAKLVRMTRKKRLHKSAPLKMTPHPPRRLLFDPAEDKFLVVGTVPGMPRLGGILSAMEAVPASYFPQCR